MRLKHVHCLCVATETIYTEVISAFRNYFQTKGYKFTYEYAFQKTPKKAYSKDINIVIKAQRFFDPDELPNWSLKILFQSEQYAKLRKFKSMPYSKKWDLILDVFQENITRMYSKAVPQLRFLPIGYNSAYDMQTQERCFFLEDEHCNLDCYFFGARTKQRVALWNEHILPVAPNSRLANTDIGTEKYNNIIHAKINIFMPAWEPYFVPTMHLMQILANRKFLIVVSDTPQDYFPYVDNKHFLVFPSSNLRDRIEFSLNHPYLRKQLVEEKMWPDLITNHKFQYYLSKALKGFV